MAQWWIIVDTAIIIKNQEGTPNMKMWQGIFFGIILCAGSSYAEECSDIAYEENECVEIEGEVRCHRHYHLPEHSVEEEHMWQERSDSSWAGKRENFIDAFIHQ